MKPDDPIWFSLSSLAFSEELKEYLIPSEHHHDSYCHTCPFAQDDFDPIMENGCKGKATKCGDGIFVAWKYINKEKL